MPTLFRKISALSDVIWNEATPLSDHHLAKTTYEIFERGAREFSNKVALRYLYSGHPDDPTFDYTYQDFFAALTQAANAFRALDISNHDVVSLLLPNIPQTHVALWGAEAIAIANPINPLLHPAHIISLLNEAQSKVLVTLAPSANPAMWEGIVKMIPAVPSLKAILTVNLAVFQGNVKIANDLSSVNGVRVIDFDQFIAEQPHTLIDRSNLKSQHDVACYFHTGGTTGVPKIAMHTHFNQVFCAWMTGRELDWNEHDVIHAGLPLFHVNAPLISGLAAFTVGAEVVMTSPQGFRSPTVLANFWQLVERYKISFFMGVPAVYVELNKRWSNAYDVSSLKVAACGAAPMPVALINEFEARSRIRILEGYGLTEGGVLSSVNPCFGKRLAGTIGIRIPYQEMKAVKLNAEGRLTGFCLPNEIGVIAIRGPNVFKGYLRAEDNLAIWLEDGWLNTGDLGSENEAGYFTLAGRKKDLIIRGGHNIDPRLTEEALSTHPAVSMVAAVGRPDVRLGELPVAYVTLREGQSVTAEQLKAHAAEQVSEKAAAPYQVFIIEQMPLTSVGKIYKPDLRFDMIKKVIHEVAAKLQIPVDEVSVQHDAHPIEGTLVSIHIPESLLLSFKEPITSSLRLFSFKWTLQAS